ncbi:MAG: ATP-binding cassette domain-containing protein [Thalassolituus oleivorans]|jgi:iron complex transport system ATP-binding protein|uniref:ABC transporter ATP-binding protein n=1 Tax=Thalassolituus oleivorans TaxID=187493 RepID=UPI001B55538D|nr:ATP-binding cassette domain-containing protein [Thalassolituus oleivorans]MBQ0727865.1 ATP-binding cassette domain-containing protein [Thalassolituus oleivorans]
MSASLLTVEGLSLHRGGAALVNQVSFNVKAGELIMLVGPNGAGKSTLLSMLAGLQRGDAGSVAVLQRATHTWPRNAWAEHVTFVPQLSSMNFPLTVRDVVSLGGLAHSTSMVTLRQQVKAALQGWDIDYLADHDVRRLSGGEQQRCQLARSWVQMQQAQSILWLLDEPLSALDLRHQHQCLQQIRAITAQGKSVLMVVHDLNMARQHADRVLMMCCGELVADGSAEQVLSAEQVSRVFQVETYLDHGWLGWR